MKNNFKLYLRRLELNSKIKNISVLILCLASLYLFSSIILAQFLPWVLAVVFLTSVYYFLVNRKSSDSFGIRLVMLSLVLMFVSSIFINNILFGIQSYVSNKYNLGEKGQYIYCSNHAPVWLVIDKCYVPDNARAEKEANLINRISNNSFVLIFLLGGIFYCYEKAIKTKY